MEIPILCAKCHKPVYLTLEKLKEIELIECSNCRFKFKNPTRMKDAKEMMDSIKKAEDC